MLLATLPGSRYATPATRAGPISHAARVRLAARGAAVAASGAVVAVFGIPKTYDRFRYAERWGIERECRLVGRGSPLSAVGSVLRSHGACIAARFRRIPWAGDRT